MAILVMPIYAYIYIQYVVMHTYILYFRCLDLYFGCPELYLVVRTCVGISGLGFSVS